MTVVFDAATVDRGYRRAARSLARNGRTYHLASRLLPAPNRRAIAALYGYARLVDDIVDHTGPPNSVRTDIAAGPDDVLHHLTLVQTSARAAMGSAAGSTGCELSDDERETIAALADTVNRWQIPTDYFDDFHRSMRMDAPGSDVFTDRYATWPDLARYTRGSAAVIGLMLLPVLGLDENAATRAAPAAATLGDAFQLTNFLRDVGEDLDRGRIYLPMDELAAFGVDETTLRIDRDRGMSSRPLRRALAHLIAVNRDQYRRAAPGFALLPPRIRTGIAAAARSYSEILAVIESPRIDVMAARAVVPRRVRAGHALAAALRVAAAGAGVD